MGLLAISSCAAKTATLTPSRSRSIGLWDVVAVIDDDRYLREQHEVRLRHFDRAQRSAAEGYGRRRLSLRERKVEPRIFDYSILAILSHFLIVLVVVVDALQ